MEIWKKNLIVLFIGSLIVSASYSMVVPFLPLFLEQIGVHQDVETWSGILFSVAFFGGAISAPYWGSLADRFGRKPMIIRSGIALVVTYILIGFVYNPYLLLLIRLTQGLLSGYIPNSIALIGSNTPENRVGFSLSMVSSATAAGGIIGPLFGGVLANWLGNRTAFVSAGVIVLLATALAIIWVKEVNFVPTKKRSSVFSAFAELKHNRSLMVALSLNLLTSFSIMTVEPVITLYIEQLSHSATNASLVSGIVFSLTGIANVVFAPLWGRTADRIGFTRTLFFGLLGGTIGTLMQLPFHNIYAFAAVRFMYGAFFCAVYPAINGLIVKATAADFRGRAFGLNQTANQIGNMVGPLVGGVVGTAYSIHGVFWVTGTLLGIVTILHITITHRTTSTHSP